MDHKDTLVLIPARGGSKGVPDKNIKSLHGKPLILYTTEIARKIFDDQNICVSTDSTRIKEVVENSGLAVPFLRPAELATDTAGSYEVILHAINWYREKGKSYSKVLLLQPTSPFRDPAHFTEIFSLFDEVTEMVVSVGISHQNPYFSLFEEDENGYLRVSKKGNFSRRQDCPPVYYFNGSMYLMSTEAVRKGPLSSFNKVKKICMEEKYCLDIDTPLDWVFCETLLEKGLI